MITDLFSVQNQSKLRYRISIGKFTVSSGYVGLKLPISDCLTYYYDYDEGRLSSLFQYAHSPTLKADYGFTDLFRNNHVVLEKQLKHQRLSGGKIMLRFQRNSAQLQTTLKKTLGQVKSKFSVRFDLLGRIQIKKYSLILNRKYDDAYCWFSVEKSRTSARHNFELICRKYCRSRDFTLGIYQQYAEKYGVKLGVGKMVKGVEAKGYCSLKDLNLQLSKEFNSRVSCAVSWRYPRRAEGWPLGFFIRINA